MGQNSCLLLMVVQELSGGSFSIWGSGPSVLWWKLLHLEYRKSLCSYSLKAWCLWLNFSFEIGAAGTVEILLYVCDIILIGHIFSV